MKKLTILLLFIFSVATSYGQLGVRAGFNLSNISGDTALFGSPDAGSGFQVGLTYSAALSDKLAFRPGLLYSVKGFKISFGGVEDATTFNYLEIPLDFVFSAYDAASFGIDVHAGPYIGYMLSGESGGESFEFDEDEGLARTDFGLNFGGTVDFSGIYVGLNYGLGLSNLNTDEEFDFNLKNTNLSFIAGYMFGGGSMDK